MGINRLSGLEHKLIKWWFLFLWSFTNYFLFIKFISHSRHCRTGEIETCRFSASVAGDDVGEPEASGLPVCPPGTRFSQWGWRGSCCPLAQPIHLPERPQPAHARLPYPPQLSWGPIYFLINAHSCPAFLRILKPLPSLTWIAANLYLGLFYVAWRAETCLTPL